MEPAELDARTWSGLEYLESISGPGAIAEMVDDYLADVPKRFENIRQALASGDTALLNRLAHDLKSNSATLGALQLSMVAAALEHEAEEAAHERLQSLLDQAETLFPSVRLALEIQRNLHPGDLA